MYKQNGTRERVISLETQANYCPAEGCGVSGFRGLVIDIAANLKSRNGLPSNHLLFPLFCIESFTRILPNLNVANINNSRTGLISINISPISHINISPDYNHRQQGQNWNTTPLKIPVNYRPEVKTSHPYKLFKA